MNDRRDPRRLAATIERVEAHIAALRAGGSIEARQRARLLELAADAARRELHALVRRNRAEDLASGHSDIRTRSGSVDERQLS